MDEFVRELKESAAGLYDGEGGHADYCAELMEKAAKHIAELEENATAQALALKAAKAMQQAETERADKAESELQRINRLAQCGTVQNFLALSDDEKGKAFAVMMRTDKAQIDMINELEVRADANERDAERYRYIRTKERMMLDTDDGEARMTTTFSSADKFDDAIDKAMEKDK